MTEPIAMIDAEPWARCPLAVAGQSIVLCVGDNHPYGPSPTSAS
jgi:hypothetical protein